MVSYETKHSADKIAQVLLFSFCSPNDYVWQVSASSAFLGEIGMFSGTITLCTGSS